MWDLWLSGLHQPAIVAAEEAGFFSALAEAPATAAELATRLGFDERATTILVRLLAALRLLLRQDGRYHLGDEARTYLVKGSPWSTGRRWPASRSVSEHREPAAREAEATRLEIRWSGPKGRHSVLCRGREPRTTGRREMSQRSAHREVAAPDARVVLPE